MAPAEIIQGGNVVNIIKGSDDRHIGKLDGREVEVKDEEPGCKIHSTKGGAGKHLQVGSSITLEGGEIVKSVRYKLCHCPTSRVVRLRYTN